MERTILVVDDTQDIRQLVRMVLEMKGCHVLEAENGQEAVELAKKADNALDLILMDLRMPVLDGYEATRKIHSEETTHHVPIVAMSAHCHGDWRTRALEAGAVECVSKPVDFEQLDRILGQYIH